MMVLACATSFCCAVYVELHNYPTRLYEGVAIAIAGCAGISLVLFSVPLAGFFAAGMLLGLITTFIQRWFFVNNFITALCAAAPALIGVVYYQEVSLPAIYLAALLFILVFVYEILCDIESRAIDVDQHKLTMPVLFGKRAATITACVLLGNGVLVWCKRDYFNTVERIICAIIGVFGVLGVIDELAAWEDSQIDSKKIPTDFWKWMIRLALVVILLSRVLL